MNQITSTGECIRSAFKTICLFLFTLLVMSCVILGCGREAISPVSPDEPIPVPGPVPPGPTPPVPPLPPAPGQEKVIVAVFGAPWCSACKSGIPEVQRQLKKLPASKLAQIDFRLYVPTGANSGSRPTQAVADQYKQILHLDLATAYVDPYRWTNYQDWVGSYLAIPAAAILDEKLNVLRRYPPGVGFSPPDIAHFAASQVK